MKTTPNFPRILLLSALALGLSLVGLTGCDQVSPSEEPPNADMAADLAVSSQAAATVDQNLDLAELFVDPMGSAVADLGLDGDTDFDPWSGEGVDFPQLALMNARAFESSASLMMLSAADARQSRKARMDLPAIAWGAGERAEGDTLAVEYFDAADSTGLNALIEGATPDMVRFVVIRDYPNAADWQVNHRESEILIDTQGTLEDDGDDEYHRLFMTESWGNGQVATGEILPESGSGPILPETVAVATYRVDQPMWHPLQAWNESELRLEPGDFDVDGDEIAHSMMFTVHFVNDAEEVVNAAAADEGPIEDGSEVVLNATFTAAPDNAWLESIVDEIRANLGNLEDEEDDLLLELSRESVFDGVDYEGNSPRASVTLTPEYPVTVGQEPCGGNFQEDVYYPADWWVWSIQRQVDIACDGSGSAHVHMNFADGSSLDRTITWTAGGEATLTESRPDGVTVTGSWNENTGAYTVTTDFASGSDPWRRVQDGTVSEGHVEARDEFFWNDEHVDYTEFAADETTEGWSIAGTRVEDGESETFTLSGGETELTGTWARSGEGTDASGGFTLTALEGGGAHLVFDAEDPLAEGEPSVSGDFWYAPDGSGNGTLVYTQFGKTVTYEVEWEANGEGSLTDGQGNTAPLG